MTVPVLNTLILALQICGTSVRQLVSIEEELKEAVALLKARYDWMVSGRCGNCQE